MILTPLPPMQAPRRMCPFHPDRLEGLVGGAFPGVLRSKGFAWCASQHDTSLEWSQVGVTVQ